VADESGVARTLVSLISQTLYPNGTGAPSIVRNATPVIVRRGWPDETNLRNDLNAGKAYVTVFTRSGAEINVTAYSPEWKELSRSNKTITATVEGNAITLGGSVTLPHNLHVKGAGGYSVGYTVVQGDTLTSIATALASLIDEEYPGTTSVGPTITVAGFPGILSVGIGVAGMVYKEVKRQQKSFQVICWTATPQVRDSLGSILDPVLADQDHITFAEGDSGWVWYESTMTFDSSEEEGLWRRDLFYRIEYATLITAPATEVVGVTARFVGGQGQNQTPADPPLPTRTVNR
jgi:uncharacterized Zn ribbon protein